MKNYGKKAMWAIGALLMATPVFAQGAGETAGGGLSTATAVVLAAGLAIAIAAGLCGLGQGKIGAAACEGMARNPQASGVIQTAMLLSLAFIETLVLLTFVVILIKVK